MSRLIIAGKPGPAGPSPAVSWTGDRLTVGGVQGPPLTGPAPTISWTGDVVTIGGEASPPLTGPASTVPGPPGPTAFGLSVSSPITVTPGVKDEAFPLLYSIGVTRWVMVSNENTTASVRIWRQDGTEITGSVLPTLTNAKRAEGTTLTGWDTDLVDGDVLYMQVVNNDNAKYLAVFLAGA